MPSCVVRWCKTHSRLTCPGLTIHSFPSKPIRRKEWIAAVRLERQDNNWMPTKASKVCSIHFDETSFYISKEGRTMLKNTAIPDCTMIRLMKEKPSIATVSSGDPSTSNNSTKKRELENSIHYNEDEETKKLRSMENSTNLNSSVQEIGVSSCTTPINIPSSDIESALNTPVTHMFKQKLEQKTQLASNRLSKIRNLTRKNKRFPKNPAIKEKWIKATGREDNWNPTLQSVVCSRHFTDDCFRPVGMTRILHRDACPTLALPLLGSFQGGTVTAVSTINFTPQQPSANSNKPQNGYLLILPAPSSSQITPMMLPATSSPITPLMLPTATSSQITPVNNQLFTSITPNITTVDNTNNKSNDCNSPTEKRWRRTVLELKQKLKQKNVMVKRLQTSNRTLKRKLTLLKVLLNELEKKFISMETCDVKIEIEPKEEST